MVKPQFSIDACTNHHPQTEKNAKCRQDLGDDFFHNKWACQVIGNTFYSKHRLEKILVTHFSEKLSCQDIDNKFA